MSTLGIFSDPLDDRRGTHAYADAESDERRLPVAALQLVEHGSNNHGAGGAERMAHGNGAAVHVDLVVRNVERLHVTQDNRGKSLVELVEVNVLYGHAGLLEHLLGDRDRACQHDRGFGPDIGEGLDTRAWLQARGLAGFFTADEHCGGTIDDAGRIA